jgi:DNA-binding MarR family transcriptional regulator
VARLAEKGLVERAEDPHDRRSALISATSEGRSLLRRLRGRKNAYLARRMRELDPADVAALERATAVLERMLESERRP